MYPETWQFTPVYVVNVALVVDVRTVAMKLFTPELAPVLWHTPSARYVTVPDGVAPFPPQLLSVVEKVETVTVGVLEKKLFDPAVKVAGQVTEEVWELVHDASGVQVTTVAPVTITGMPEGHPVAGAVGTVDEVVVVS